VVPAAGSGCSREQPPTPWLAGRLESCMCVHSCFVFQVQAQRSSREQHLCARAVAVRLM
jgi:hypothetical protein